MEQANWGSVFIGVAPRSAAARPGWQGYGFLNYRAVQVCFIYLYSYNITYVYVFVRYGAGVRCGPPRVAGLRLPQLPGHAGVFSGIGVACI